MPHVLILGGTSEASALARALAHRRVSTVLSYAGRVASPRSQPVPVRVGGFGGVVGLADYLRAERVTHLVDATHPFAARISANAALAAADVGVALVALTRPAWQAGPGDLWQSVPDIAGAVAALAGPPRRVMLGLGRLHAHAFAAQPQHRYLLRFVDKPEVPPPLPRHHLVVDRGPFTVEADLRLMEEHRIERLVCKNAGGDGAAAKLVAARALGLPVVMIARPALPARLELADVPAVLAWLDHGVERGV